ncbi:hypothetical protein VNI00_018689 [Paramarasmius palmivorus]|uniref:JmjC domain-containing protein n=1 Tax=Paramarasmius palmivorus TaxID=297713 RepID=A0AAW0AVM7_9AGAR
MELASFFLRVLHKGMIDFPSSEAEMQKLLTSDRESQTPSDEDQTSSEDSSKQTVKLNYKPARYRGPFYAAMMISPLMLLSGRNLLNSDLNRANLVQLWLHLGNERPTELQDVERALWFELNAMAVEGKSAEHALEAFLKTAECLRPQLDWSGEAAMFFDRRCGEEPATDRVHADGLKALVGYMGGELEKKSRPLPDTEDADHGAFDIVASGHIDVEPESNSPGVLGSSKDPGAAVECTNGQSPLASCYTSPSRHTSPSRLPSPSRPASPSPPRHTSPSRTSPPRLSSPSAELHTPHEDDMVVDEEEPRYNGNTTEVHPERQKAFDDISTNQSSLPATQTGVQDSSEGLLPLDEVVMGVGVDQQDDSDNNTISVPLEVQPDANESVVVTEQKTDQVTEIAATESETVREEKGANNEEPTNEKQTIEPGKDKESEVKVKVKEVEGRKKKRKDEGKKAVTDNKNKHVEENKKKDTDNKKRKKKKKDEGKKVDLGHDTDTDDVERDQTVNSDALDGKPLIKKEELLTPEQVRTRVVEMQCLDFQILDHPPVLWDKGPKKANFLEEFHALVLQSRQTSGSSMQTVFGQAPDEVQTTQDPPTNQVMLGLLASPVRGTYLSPIAHMLVDTFKSFNAAEAQALFRFYPMALAKGNPHGKNVEELLRSFGNIFVQRTVHDLSLVATAKNDPNKVHCCASLWEVYSHARDDPHGVKSVNILDLPSSGIERTRPTSLCTDDQAYMHLFDPNGPHRKQTKLYIHDTHWGLVATGHTFHGAHWDACGFATEIGVVIGCKIVHILTPPNEDYTACASLEFSRGLDSSGANTVGWEVTEIVLKDGDSIVMPPMTVHYVSTIGFTLCFGSHFYCASTIRKTCWTLLHLVHADNFTNTSHPCHRTMLCRMLTYWYDIVVNHSEWYLQQCQRSSTIRDLPNLLTFTGVMDFLSLLNIIDFGSVLWRERWLPLLEDEDKYSEDDVERFAIASQHGQQIITWFKENLAIRRQNCVEEWKLDDTCCIDGIRESLLVQQACALVRQAKRSKPSAKDVEAALLSHLNATQPELGHTVKKALLSKSPFHLPHGFIFNPTHADSYSWQYEFPDDNGDAYFDVYSPNLKLQIPTDEPFHCIVEARKSRQRRGLTPRQATSDISKYDLDSRKRKSDLSESDIESETEDLTWPHKRTRRALSSNGEEC